MSVRSSCWLQSRSPTCNMCLDVVEMLVRVAVWVESLVTCPRVDLLSLPE